MRGPITSFTLYQAVHTKIIIVVIARATIYEEAMLELFILGWWSINLREYTPSIITAQESQGTRRLVDIGYTARLHLPASVPILLLRE